MNRCLESLLRGAGNEARAVHREMDFSRCNIPVDDGLQQLRLETDYAERKRDRGGCSTPARVVARGRVSAATSMHETGSGAMEMAGTSTTHAAAPQGPSHIAPIPAQPPKTMATGPSKTQMARARMVIARRELITDASVSEMRRTVSRIRTRETKGGSNAR